MKTLFVSPAAEADILEQEEAQFAGIRQGLLEGLVDLPSVAEVTRSGGPFGK